MVETTVSTDLVMIGVTGTGIVFRLVSTIISVRVTGTVEVVDSFVITVEVTGQVVVLLDLVSIDSESIIRDWIALETKLTLCTLCSL